jgi:hypothetical protein
MRMTSLQIPTVFEHIEELLLSAVDIRQTEMHTAEPLVPESSSVETEVATEKLKIYKSPGTD